MKKLIAGLLLFVMLGVSALGMFGCDNETDWDDFDKSGEDYFLAGSVYGPQFLNNKIFGVEVGAILIGKKPQIDMGAAAAFFEEFEEELKKLEEQCSTSIETSDVAKFNRAEPGEKVYIGEYTKKMFDMSKQLWEDSDGCYNAASFNFVDYWGFAPVEASLINPGDYFFSYHPQDTATAYRPETPYPLDSPENLIPVLKEVSDFADVKCAQDENGWYLEKLCPNVTHTYQGVTTTYTLRVDFGGIAKGYAADIGMEIAKKYCITKGYIDVNSSKYLLKNGNAPGESEAVENGFPVQVRDPRHDPYNFFETSCGEISTQQKNTGLSTSADSEKYYIYPEDGNAYDNTKRYCHIIDPRTGWPINVDPNPTEGGAQNPRYGFNYPEGIISATILNKSSALTDAYATIVMVMASGGGANIQNAFDWLEATETVAVLIVQNISAGAAISFKVKCINLDNSEFTVFESFQSSYSFYE